MRPRRLGGGCHRGVISIALACPRVLDYVNTPPCPSGFRYRGRVAIDRGSAQPLQAQLADDIRRRIRTGEFAPGAKLPPLRALTTEYDVAEMTVHAAIRELQREGLLVSSRGRGTFVSEDVSSLEDVQPSSVEARLSELRKTVEDLAARVESLEAHGSNTTADRGTKP